MAIPKHGKQKILRFRLLEDEATKSAAKLALQTEHNWNYNRSRDTTQTKDGAISSGGGLEVTLDIDAVVSDDPVNNMLKRSVIEDKKLEVWDIDISATNEDGSYNATYAQGSLESWEVPSEVESFETLSTTMVIDMVPQEGKVTITPEEELEVQYVFRDTAPVEVVP